MSILTKIWHSIVGEPWWISERHKISCPKCGSKEIEMLESRLGNNISSIVWWKCKCGERFIWYGDSQQREMKDVKQ